MDKFSELKAAAMAATPRRWVAELTEVWVVSDGTADFMLTNIFGDNELSAEQDRANAAFIAAANPPAVLDLLAELEREQEMRAQNLEIKTLLAEKVKTLETKLWDSQQLVDAKSHSQNELLSQIRDLEERYGKDMSSRGKRICELDDLLEAANKRIAELEGKGREIKVWRQRCENAEKGSDHAQQRIAELEAKLATPIKIVNYDEFFICHASGASDDYCKGWVDGRNAAARDVGNAGFTVEDKQ